MSDYFDDYDIKYPDLIMEILDYFDIQNFNTSSIKDKSVMGFCELHNKGNNQKKDTHSKDAAKEQLLLLGDF